ncbi:peroxiredoxin [Marivirga tractuosa]|uniref:OsmC family protein n=1 Tax=Marivirga tractuosa (strain ATCC 23168 / DSM 4126 / NBRC 15989 / NCIMB 1408 / VKM B-1430 / H-43) TaxID=643867 RepID=E4TVJ4_MARTH|nr:OsmC family protein [Marivirga tractuosa]ADR21107.1 OsmC family protein [Marivirga tractuosa DSM 4126]BDD14438.1 peroxiredoxin [Marivirga tractuosa]
MKDHHYQSLLKWTGNTGKGTKSYTSYERSYDIIIENKPTLKGSADPGFRGDASLHNPEDVFLASISSCHMLWYLHLCAVNKITVIDYQDKASATMQEDSQGKGHFTGAILHPEVIILEKDKIELAESLHQKANEYCFIANSCNFPIQHDPTIKLAD